MHGSVDGNSKGKALPGTILQKRLPRHYEKLDVSTKNWFKSEILICLAQEPDRAIRNCIVDVAASLLELECSSFDTSWPELFQFVAVAAATSGGEQTAEVRELAFRLLQAITEKIQIPLTTQYKPIAGLLAKALVLEEDFKVQKAAVEVLGKLLSDLKEEPEVDIFAVFIPSMLQITRQQKHNNEDLILIVLDVLCDLAHSPSQAVNAHLKSMVSFGLECINTRDLGIEVHDSATQAIVTFVEEKPKRFGKEKELLAQALETLLFVLENSPDSALGCLFESNPVYKQDLKHDGGDRGEGVDMDTDTPNGTTLAQELLDKLACEIPNKYIFQPVFSSCVQKMHSLQSNQRKAGIVGIGLIAEGCAEPLKENLNEILPHVLQAARDIDAQVRECACFCLGEISEYCQPEILGYSDQILPILLGLLDDQALVVQLTSCYVLRIFCEVLTPDTVRPSLDLLVKKLSSMLETTDKRSVQEMVISALGATAVAAEVEFSPYTSDVSKLLTKFTTATDEKLHSLLGRALGSMGCIAIAVGRETFKPYFRAIMDCACGSLKWDSPRLWEFIFSLFSDLVTVMKDDFVPFLSELVPRLITVICTEEGELEPVGEPKQTRDFGPLNDSEDEDDEGGDYVLHVNPVLTEVRKSAIAAIGQLAAHTGPAFCPHLMEVVNVLRNAANESNPLIKSEAAEALPNLVISSLAAYRNNGTLWTEEGISGAILVDSFTSELTTDVLAQLIALMQYDNKETVTKACEGIKSVIELRGSSAIAPFADECMSHTYNLLTKTAPCQGSEKPNGEQPGEDDDHDEVVEAACGLVVGLCKALGAQFVHHLPRFLTVICGYSKCTRPIYDRMMVLCCLGEIALALEGAICDYWLSVFMPAISAGLVDPSEKVKQNAAFCAGICCELLKERATDQYPTLLQGLEPLFSIDPSKGKTFAACVDNVAACVARMIIASPSHVLMPKLLPAMLELLPLKIDMDENEAVYSCLLDLVHMDHPDALAHKAGVSRVFIEAISAGSKVENEIKQKLSQALPSLQ